MFGLLVLMRKALIVIAPVFVSINDIGTFRVSVLVQLPSQNEVPQDICGVLLMVVPPSFQALGASLEHRIRSATPPALPQGVATKLFAVCPPVAVIASVPPVVIGLPLTVNQLGTVWAALVTVPPVPTFAPLNRSASPAVFVKHKSPVFALFRQHSARSPEATRKIPVAAGLLELEMNALPVKVAAPGRFNAPRIVTVPLKVLLPLIV
jgi:hypothetical protein